MNAIISFFDWLLGILGLLVGLLTGGYMLYIWWGLVNNLDFLEFVASIVFFFVTIPFALIFIGVQGNWEPTILIVLGFIIVGVLGTMSKPVLKELNRWENRPLTITP